MRLWILFNKKQFWNWLKNLNFKKGFLQQPEKNALLPGLKGMDLRFQKKKSY